MGTSDQIRIGNPLAPQGPDGAKPSPAGGGGAEFRRLLEKLEDVARTSEPGATQSVEDLGGLKSALDRADDEFASVMELRNQLEAAYRSQRG